MARKAKKDPWKRKEWYSITTPDFLGSKDIGDTPADDPQYVKGRIVRTSLRDLTGNFRKYYVKLFFKVNEIKGNKAKTNFIGHDLTRDYIQSIIRRITSRIDDVVEVRTKDRAKIRVKSSIFTRRRVNSSKKAEIRKKMRELIQERAKKTKMTDMVTGMIEGKIAKELNDAIKKLCPTNRAEIKKSEVLEQAS